MLATPQLPTQTPAPEQVSTRHRGAWEWQTLLLLLLTYVGWLTLSRYYQQLPALVVAALGGLLLAMHGSLQHETIHGHPTPWRWLNTLLGGMPLLLWLPYGVYRSSHLQHHASTLANPDNDPESFYVTARQWDTASPLHRLLLRAHGTLLGRLLIGPPLAVLAVWRREARQLPGSACGRSISAFSCGVLLHLMGVALVLSWLHWACGMRFWEYLAFFVLPGTSLTLLRSFAEHSAGPDDTAIVRSNRFWSTLFLYNNLHIVHHDQPNMPWYAIPQIYRTGEQQYRQRAGASYFGGYWEVASRFALRRRDTGVYPPPRVKSVPNSLPVSSS